MNSKTELERKLRLIKPELSKKFYVDKIGYFGSFLNNEQREDSDIDILVDFRKPLGWEFFDLQDLLEKELKRKIDLHTTNSLKEQLRETILKQVKYL
ncbi:MAG: nucleotidyltransferase family protein [Ignavibacteria bacterium]|nr:nucleotidyltransferase family protein [Ignavibacteria bacterium]